MEIKPFDNKIWLATPTMHGDELRYMQQAYDSNWMSTVGENINVIEQELARKVGCGYAVALASGTSALHLAVKLAGVRQGDTVLCSDMTFAATVNPVVYEKAVPVFVDAERQTWNMDPEALEQAFRLYPEAKTVVLAHLYGTPARLDELRHVCQQHGAVLVEDAAESLGATYKGVQTGSFGTYNCISFNGNKIITGSAGGMLLTDDRRAADTARKWSTQSRENAPWYQHEQTGYNYRMSNVIAGVVRGQLPYLEDHVARKRAIYERYREGFRDLPVSMNPYEQDKAVPNFWLSCLLIQPEGMCDQTLEDTRASYTPAPGKSCPTQILEALARCNAEGRPIWKPMHLQPIFRAHGFVTAAGEDVGRDIFTRGLCLPSDIKMTTEQQDRIIEIVKSCFR